MIIHNTNKAFDHIEIMLKSLYSRDKRFNNIVIVLGYIDVEGGIKTIRTQYPNKKIITYQFEQMFKGSRWVTRQNIEFLKESDYVWDYDEVNIRFLEIEFNIKATFAPLQYVPQLTTLKILPPNECDIDVLFYGSMNPKRQEIIDSIKKLLPNRNIIASDVLWGDELDNHIQRSKVILNLHYYDTNRLEQARIFYLLANHKCVLSEYSQHNYYKNGIMMVERNKLASACKHLLNSGEWMDYSQEALKTLIFSNQVYGG